MSRAAMVLSIVLSCVCAAAAASAPVARVQLPCESSFQALSPTGTQLAVHCKDSSLYLVDIPQGSQRSVAAANHSVNSYVYSPDGRWLAVGFVDGSVQLIPSQEGAAAKKWQADAHRIDLLQFFPDAKRLFVGAVDSPGQVWELTETPIRQATLPVDFGGINDCAVSPDGKLLVTAGDDTLIRWYDTANWQKTREYRDFLLETFVLKFTPNGKQLLAGGADSRVTFFDVATGKELRQLPPEAGSSVGAIDLLGDAQRAVTLYFDNAGDKPPHVLLWDLATARSAPLKSESPPTCGGVVDGSLWLCTADGKTLSIARQQ